jgi:hypothetical protein
MLWLFQLCYCLLLKAFNLEEPANWYILLGAIIFVSSGILAFDKFYVQIMHGSFFNYGDLFVSSISYRKRNFEFKPKK